jgi:TRAP-type C4-dicarboxylate transport system substrate-binding protein
LPTTHIQAEEWRVATSLPDGTEWSEKFLGLNSQLQKQDIKLKVQWGGSAGPDQQVLDKIQAGALEGALLAGPALSQTLPDMRLGEIPFYFSNMTAWESWIKKSEPIWLKQKKDMVLLGVFKIGAIYFFSTEPVKNLQSLKGLSVWRWPGDPLAKAASEELGLKSVDVEPQFVLDSFKSKKIQVAYAPAALAAAVQWNTVAQHQLSEPIGYSVGGFFVKRSLLEKIEPKKWAELQTIVGKHLASIDSALAADEKEALKILSANVTKHSLASNDLKVLGKKAQIIKNKM